MATALHRRLDPGNDLCWSTLRPGASDTDAWLTPKTSGGVVPPWRHDRDLEWVGRPRKGCRSARTLVRPDGTVIRQLTWVDLGMSCWDIWNQLVARRSKLTFGRLLQVRCRAGGACM